jgi:ATP-binding cassette ChvD family protein
MQGLQKVAGDGRKILDGIWLSFFPGVKIGVIGPNGSGKSTLLRVMAGLDDDHLGETWIDPNASVGYLAQEPQLDPALDVRGNIEQGMGETKVLMDAYDAVSARFAEELTAEEMDAVITEQARLQEKIDAVDGWDLERTLEIAMDALRVPPGDRDVTTLSGGEARRVALCQLLLAKPDLLLLDEPTNHLDAETVAWLERTLADYHGTVIIVTHDRYFLDNVTGWILELESGKGLPFEGNYSSWLAQKSKRLADEGSGRAGQARAKALAEELAWAQLNQTDRNARAHARLQRYEQLLTESRGDGRRTEIVIPPGERLGELVVRATDLKKGYDDRLLYENLTFDLPRGGIVGIVGPNGAGKTTLFRMILGQEEPDGGTLEVGESVDIASIDQFRDAIDAEATVFDNIAKGREVLKVGNRTVNMRAYVGAFGLRGTMQQQLAGSLSGGERNRLFLAMMLQEGANVLLLDEPSNDLDVATLRALEEAMEGFAGCVAVISHDRWFLDRVATHILAFEGDSEVVWFEGNYAAYERDRKRRKGEDADQPRRLKFKPLVRG